VDEDSYSRQGGQVKGRRLSENKISLDDKVIS